MTSEMGITIAEKEQIKVYAELFIVNTFKTAS